MKILLDIKDSKVEFVLELLNNLGFVKVKPLSDKKAELMSEVRDAVEELKLVREGKLQARNAQDLIDEL